MQQPSASKTQVLQVYGAPLATYIGLPLDSGDSHHYRVPQSQSQITAIEKRGIWISATITMSTTFSYNSPNTPQPTIRIEGIEYLKDSQGNHEVCFYVTNASPPNIAIYAYKLFITWTDEIK